jgi:pseudaminic acid synthase
MSTTVTINGREIGEGKPIYVIAEMSGNHHGDFERSVEIIRAMKKSGADAVKVQTFTPDELTIQCNHDSFTVGKGTIWEGRELYDLYGEVQMPWEWQAKLKKVTEDLGMDFFSTPQGKESTDFLEELDVPVYKIASFEILDLDLIAYVASKGKPVIISTGMANIEEVADAVEAVRLAGNDDIILLKCTSAYPSPPKEANLKTIPDLAERFSAVSGLSDHSLDLAVPVAAVALGACVIEKHFTLSREDKGPDSPFSLEPHEFKSMVDTVRVTEEALGTVSYELTPAQEASRVFRRSLFVTKDIQEGEEFTKENVRCIRPGYGIAPKKLSDILGKTAKRAIARGTPLDFELVSAKELLKSS